MIEDIDLTHLDAHWLDVISNSAVNALEKINEQARVSNVSPEQAALATMAGGFLYLYHLAQINDLIDPNDIPTKSGIILGMGETFEEVINTLRDLRDVGCDLLTVGQYLQPSPKHVQLEKFYTPQEFESIKSIALEMGFVYVASGPLVRSSYHAEKHLF